MTTSIQSLDIATLAAAYRAGLSPLELVEEVYRRIDAAAGNPIWITLTPKDTSLARARALAANPGARDLPLYGIPFAVKDNIDVAGLATTAACPDFAYTPGRSSGVVERLLAAGAICIGKTNLDQFATGLVGSRSPYGAVRNAINPTYLSGGSSSGSAVAVALGQVSFSLGTDTAGSGRVPASFNNIVGLKPTRGRLSARGVVPACRTLDCISIFTGSCADAGEVLAVAEGTDSEDAYSRTPPAHHARSTPVIGVPRAEDLQWFGDTESPGLYADAVERLERLGARVVPVNIKPFLDTGRLLYGGPWVAERYAAIREFFSSHPQSLMPVTRQIIGEAERYSAVDAFVAQYRLAELAAITSPVWQHIDALCVPTAGTIYTREQDAREPVAMNTNLGLYTNFVNLLDLAAIAVPTGLRADGMPFGITLVATAGSDRWLCRIGAGLHEAGGLPIGATAWKPNASRTASIEPTGEPLRERLPANAAAFEDAGAGDASPDAGAPEHLPNAASHETKSQGAADASATVPIAVVGAHLSGEPLNHQLTTRGARLLRSARTAPVYQLFELPDSTPPKPGMIYGGPATGTAIEVEIWALSERDFGSFVAAIPAPLGIGTLALEDGSSVKGFLCESHALAGAKDISSFGGWRAYLKRGTDHTSGSAPSSPQPEIEPDPISVKGSDPFTGSDPVLTTPA